MKNITGKALNVLVLFLLTTATLLISQRVQNETFQQFKVIGFVILMFTSLGIFGLPYINYDSVQNPPTLTFFMTALGILALLGSLFVYMLNWQVDTVVVGISSFVAYTAGVSELSDAMDTNPELSNFLQYILGGAVLFGVYKGSAVALKKDLVANATVRSLMEIVVGVAPILLWGIVSFALYKGIRALVEYRAAVRPCAKDKPAQFEPFQVATPAPAAESLPQLLQAAIDRVQTTLDTLVEQTDSTCAIMKEVEQGYVGARSGPEDEVEYQLPPEEQDRRKQTRQERAMKAFATSRKMFAASRNTSPLECFQDVPTSEYDLQVRELCAELHGLLENAETLTQIRNIQRMEADLAFAERQLNKAEGFQDMAVAAGPTPTQIYSVLEGAELEAAAKGLLAKELNLRNAVQQLQQKVKDMRSRMSKTYTKMNMVATGDYNVTENQLKGTQVNLVNP